jgi:hypothetical protein
MGKVVLPTHKTDTPTPLCPTHSQKWLMMPYLALGSRKIQKGRWGSTGKIPLLASLVGRQPLFITSGFTQAGVYARRNICANLEFYRPQEHL